MSLYQIRCNHAGDAMRIANATHVNPNPMTDRVIARVRGTELLGGVLYNDYAKRSLAFHIAGFHPDWLNKSMLWVAFHYPFIKLGVEKIFARNPSVKQDVIEKTERLGFKHEATLRDVYPGSDLTVLSMYKDTCRWLKLQDDL